MSIDGKIQFNDIFSTGSYPMKNSNILLSMCDGAATDFYNGMFLQVSQNFTHTANSVSLVFTSDIESAFSNTGWWGVINNIK